jgi:amidase
VVGKTNGPCLWGDDSVFPPTRNPWNRARTAGGSSTGPAVAVAAGLTPLDIAADSSGSIQCPAAYCGVLGMRPTEHRVPLTGTLFIDPVRKFRVLTTAGPMARTVADLRLAMQLISGPDRRDPEVPPMPWREPGPAELAGLRVAYSPDKQCVATGGSSRHLLQGRADRDAGTAAAFRSDHVMDNRMSSEGRACPALRTTEHEHQVVDQDARRYEA